MTSKYKIILTDCDNHLIGRKSRMDVKQSAKQVDAIYDINPTFGIEKTEGKRLV